MVRNRSSLTLTESRMTLRGWMDVLPSELGSRRRHLRVRRRMEDWMMQCCGVLRVLRRRDRVVR